MIFIVVKFPVRPERSAQWLSDVAEYTVATRAEPGNMFFEWSTSVEDPDTFVLVEGFADGTAEAHVGSPHFKEAMSWMPDAITDTPDIISVSGVAAEGWGKMGEVQPRAASQG